jgi:hypothetical protein
MDMHMERFGLPNCLGSVDGTLVPLWRKPDVQRLETESAAVNLLILRRMCISN